MQCWNLIDDASLKTITIVQELKDNMYVYLCVRARMGRRRLRRVQCCYLKPTIEDYQQRLQGEDTNSY